MNAVSPCVGLCKLDAVAGYCLGCARTGTEIATWRSAPEAERAAIWDALPERFAELGVTGRRLPWDTGEIRDFVVGTLRKSEGTWVTGVVGAVAEFCAPPGGQSHVEVSGDDVVARTEGAALHFTINDDVRALTFEASDVEIAGSRIVLAVKRERGHPAFADALSALGPDARAIDAADRGLSLFDLGLGRKEARFCVRLGAGPAQNAMMQALGTPFPENLPHIGPALLHESPVRVVESAIGRIEVATPIPPPTGASPPGPHTHLLPDHLATGRATPAGFDLPSAYWPGAIFYPRA